MVELAEVVAMGSLARRESRGSHFRLDFPERDDANWLYHTYAYPDQPYPRLELREVTLGQFEVKERVY
jgi:succinate dehydrogenase / fumarate reductase flavoprotein subunit